MCMYVCVHMYADVLRGQKRVVAHLQLELQMAVSSHTGTEKSNPGPVEKPSVLLTIESTLCSLCFYQKNKIKK